MNLTITPQFTQSKNVKNNPFNILAFPAQKAGICRQILISHLWREIQSPFQENKKL